MVRTLKNTDLQEKLIEAFKVFDKTEIDLVFVTEFRYVMNNIEENLIIEGVDKIIKEVGLDSNDLMKFEDFVGLRMSKK